MNSDERKRISDAVREKARAWDEYEAAAYSVPDGIDRWKAEERIKRITEYCLVDQQIPRTKSEQVEVLERIWGLEDGR